MPVEIMQLSRKAAVETGLYWTVRTFLIKIPEDECLLQKCFKQTFQQN
jgi:hypothetical protein